MQVNRTCYTLGQLERGDAVGCLLLILLGVSPRLAVVALWLLTDWVERAFGSSWILPLAGLILLPWTTALYVVGYVIGDAAAPWGILGAIIGLFLDVALHAGSATMTRRRYAS
jgi:hypothetical protein